MKLKSSPRQWLIPLALIVIAAIPRIYALSLMEYQADEAKTIHFVTNALKSQKLTPVGLISSVGVRNPPLLIYLLLPPALISAKPLFLAFIIALANAILVGVFYQLLHKYYPRHLILGASLLMATAPWAIMLSRKIWAQDLIPLFAVPVLYLIHAIRRSPNAKAIFFLSVLLTLNLQLHLSGLFFAAAICIVYFPSIKKYLKSFVLGIAIGLIPLLPYVHFQLSQNPPCPDCQALIAHVQKSPNATNFNHLLNFSKPLTGISWSTLLGNQPHQNFTRQYPINRVAPFAFLSIMLLVFLGLVQSRRQKSISPLIPVILIFIFGLFLTKTPAHIHYYQNLLPMLSLFAVSGLDHVIKNTKFFYGALLLIALVNLVFIFSFFSFLQANPVTDGDYGTTYDQSSAWVSEAVANYQNRPNYPDLLLAAHLSAQSLPLHSESDVQLNLAWYFIQTDEPELAKLHETRAKNLNPQNQRLEQLQQIFQNPP